jgi:hypothetical protein
MPPEKVIWLWPKSNAYSLLQFLILLFIIYLVFKIIGHYTRRSENAKLNWYRLNHIATRRGLRWSERRVLYQFFNHLTLRHRETLFHSKYSMRKELFHFLANHEGEDAGKYLELLNKLDSAEKPKLQRRENFQGLIDLETEELLAFRVKKLSGLAVVSEKLDGQIMLSIKGKKYNQLPNHFSMHALAYRSGVGLLSIHGKAQKMSHNLVLFSAS